MRLDSYIANLASISRQKARMLIKRGQVQVDSITIIKPAYIVQAQSHITLAKDLFIEKQIFCSRAALKLRGFLAGDMAGNVAYYSYVDSRFFHTQSYFFATLQKQAYFQGHFIKWLESYRHDNNKTIENLYVRDSKSPKDSHTHGYSSSEDSINCKDFTQYKKNKDSIKLQEDREEDREKTHTKNCMPFLVKKALCAMIANSIVLDVGASAGGFSQVLLSYGAKLIIAQDVGTSQLDMDLRNRDEVISIENVDIRNFARDFESYMPLLLSALERLDSKEKQIAHPNENKKPPSQNNIFFLEKAQNENPQNAHDALQETIATESHKSRGQFVQFLVCDVSFISLRQIFSALFSLCKSMLLLFKPQYEVGMHAKRNKKGVVLDKKAVIKSLESFIAFLQEMGALYIFVEKSPLHGKEGNEEFFIFCQF